MEHMEEEPEGEASFVDRHHPLLRITAVGGAAVDVALTLPPTAAFSTKPVGRWSAAEVLELIQWEVRHMRAGPLNGLLVIDDPQVPTMALTPAGDTRLCEGEGPPWVVSCRLSGAEDGPYHVPGGIRVRMLLDRAYPRTPPEVHFMQTLHHFFIEHDNGLPPTFYELLEDTGDAGRHTLRATLLLVRIMLQTPLHPCEGCQSQFDAYAQMHQARRRTRPQARARTEPLALALAPGPAPAPWPWPWPQPLAPALSPAAPASPSRRGWRRSR